VGTVAALSLLIYVPTIVGAQRIFVLAQFPFQFSHLVDVFTTALTSNADVLYWTWLIAAGIAIVASSFIIFRFQGGDGRGEQHIDLAIFSLTALGVGTALYFWFLKASRLTTEPWYYMVLMGLIALSIEIGVELVATNTPLRLLRLACVIAAVVVTLPIAWDEISLRQTNIDVIAAQLGGRASRGDFVVVIPWFNGVTFQNYYRGATAWSSVPPIRDLTFTRGDLLLEQIVLERPLQPIFDTIEQTLRAGNRVWVVGALSVPPAGQAPPALPRPPNGPNGWYSGDYLRMWNLQLGRYMELHSVSAERIDLQVKQPINRYEDSAFLVFSGWRS